MKVNILSNNVIRITEADNLLGNDHILDIHPNYKYITVLTQTNYLNHLYAVYYFGLRKSNENHRFT